MFDLYHTSRVLLESSDLFTGFDSNVHKQSKSSTKAIENLLQLRSARDVAEYSIVLGCYTLSVGK